jgi:hypothetical protein
MLSVLIAIGVGIALGRLLYTQAGGASVTIYSAIGTLTTTFWMIVGVFMIVGGFTVGGVLVVMFGFYFASGNYQRYKQERGTAARSWLAGSK